ncbi:MAG: cyclopropane fatty acyl phospholipid synthase [Patescibacteria group bacterium]
MTLKEKAEELLNLAGIAVNGTSPWDIHVRDERLYGRALSGGSLALGESYMDGWWDAEDLAEFFDRVLRADLVRKVRPNLESLVYYVMARFTNLQSRERASHVAELHYNIGNDLYLSFLDPYNQYTCGYFKDTDDLNVAQEKKLDLICRKLELKSGEHVLDIGSGWGGFAKFAAERYGVRVTGVSISDEQLLYAREFCKGLPVTFVKRDYRALEGLFDKVLICGMIEHVGYKNYRTLMEVVHRVLRGGGLFLLHTIGGNSSATSIDPWIHKYIFRNGMLPSITQLGAAIERLFVMEDWHNFSAYYDKTCVAWFRNFDARWVQLKEKYGERFYRMWKYYLLSSAGSFRSRSSQLWQIVLSKEGVPGGYVATR